MDGGTCPTDAGEAADMLNTLMELGLVGQRLTVSLGSEDSLAAQLADKMGIERKAWHLDFVKGQVKSAVMMEDLEARASGSCASSSVRGIQDAMYVNEKSKVKALEPTDPVVVITPRPKKGLLGKSVMLRSGRMVTEEVVAVEKLVSELQTYDAPVLKEVERAINPLRKHCWVTTGLQLCGGILGTGRRSVCGQV